MSVLACHNSAPTASYLSLAGNIHPFVNEQANFHYQVEPTFHRTVSAGPALSVISIERNTEVQSENLIGDMPHTQVASLSTLDTLADVKNMSIRRKTSMRVTHKSSWGTKIPCPSKPGTTRLTDTDTDSMEDIDLNARCGASDVFSTVDTEVTAEPHNRQRLSFAVEKEHLDLDLREHDPYYGYPSDEENKPHPFQKWIKSLHKRNLKRMNTLQPRYNRCSTDDADGLTTIDDEASVKLNSRRHKKSSSWSSSGLVTAVRSTTASLAGFSAGALSRGASRVTRRSTLKKSIRSSNASHARKLDSGDESIDTLIMDEASVKRAIQRRRTIGELVSSEESYIADLKVLANVYFTLLVSQPPLLNRNISHIHDTITEIIVLHQDLHERMRQVLEYPRKTVKQPGIREAPVVNGHNRWHSVDSSAMKMEKSSNFFVRRSLDISSRKASSEQPMISEPADAVEVAIIFENMMGRFFVYEEYGARYESMLCDMIATTRNIPNWPLYERGIEALANTLAPTSTRDGLVSRKGLTFGDLLIKPIQRVCRYPLLFQDLLKHTPVIDCPESYTTIEKVCCCLRDTAKEINRVTNDEQTRDRIQRSWSLQDLLQFPSAMISPFSIRTLGHSTLCGVLHVAYQTKTSFAGEYTLCALFKSCLILAIPNEAGRLFSIVAVISLSDLRIETTDNGKGLQCHTALYSWKINFESNQQLFELILSACSATEERTWKKHLLKFAVTESEECCKDETGVPARYSFLSLDLKPVGSVLGQPGTLTRRISIQRAATVGSRCNPYQVIIKNTHALKDGLDVPNPVADPSVSRSKSHLSTNRIPVLNPKRIDRIRMEQNLSKVWTKDLLPYPGMGGRSDHLIRASANSVMRKLSRASIASGFSKRSTSFSSVTNSHFGDPQGSLKSLQERSSDFHSPLGPMASSPSTTRLLQDSNENMAMTGMHGIIPPARTSSARGHHSENKRSSMKSRPWTATEESADTMVQDDVVKMPKAKKWVNPLRFLRSLSNDGKVREFFH